MADEVEKVVVEKATKKEKPIPIEEKYLFEDLLNASEALGYKKEVVMGAFFNVQITEMTKKDFTDTIQNFLGKKVK